MNTSDFLVEITFQLLCTYLEMYKGDLYRQLVKTCIVNALKKYEKSLLVDDCVCFTKIFANHSECVSKIFMIRDIFYIHLLFYCKEKKNKKN